MASQKCANKVGMRLEDTPLPTYPLISTPAPHSPPATAGSSSHSSLSVQPKSTQFKFATEEELSTFARGVVPENTTSSSQVLQHNMLI